MPVKLHQLDCSLPASASMPSASVVTASQPPRLFMAIVPTSSKPRMITEQWTTLAIAVPLTPCHCERHNQEASDGNPSNERQAGHR